MNLPIIPVESIREFIGREQARFSELHKDELDHLKLTITSDHVRVWAYGKKGDDRSLYRFGDGPTVEKAMEDLFNKMGNRPGKVAELREQARQLLREAAAIEKEVAS